MVGWNASHAHTYVNGSLCESANIADFANNGDSTETAGEVARDSLLIGAWRGAPDGAGTDQRGGYYSGLLDNLEVSDSGYLCWQTWKRGQYRPYSRPHLTTHTFVLIYPPPKPILTFTTYPGLVLTSYIWNAGSPCPCDRRRARPSGTLDV